MLGLNIFDAQNIANRRQMKYTVSLDSFEYCISQNWCGSLYCNIVGKFNYFFVLLHMHCEAYECLTILECVSLLF